MPWCPQRPAYMRAPYSSTGLTAGCKQEIGIFFEIVSKLLEVKIPRKSIAGNSYLQFHHYNQKKRTK